MAVIRTQDLSIEEQRMPARQTRTEHFRKREPCPGDVGRAGAVMVRVRSVLQAGQAYRLAANFGFSPEFVEYVGQVLIEPSRNTLVGRTALEGRTVHIPEIRTDPEYTWSQY